SVQNGGPGWVAILTWLPLSALASPPVLVPQPPTVKRCRAVRAAMVITVVFTLALPAAAGASIVPQRSIGGVAIGMTQAQVRAKLGKPTAVKHGTNTFGPYVNFTYAHYTVHFQGVTNVTQID